MPYVIVQHSAAGYKQDPQFAHGLETRYVNLRQAAQAQKAGGRVFNDYGDAETYCDTEQYPPGTGLVPNAPGTFVPTKIDDLRIYVPRED